MEILVIYIISVFVGCLIGSQKGQFASGLIWSLLFGPLGVIVVLCLPNLTKQKEEAERKQQMEQQLQLQQAQLRRLEQMQQPSPPPRHETTLRIASDGQDLGEMPLATVKLMLKTGKLTQQDYYFDANANDWIELASCPDLG
jgi:type II secretory pathway pseudopilin PulG